jgi:cell division transport system ATP-binding protein
MIRLHGLTKKQRGDRFALRDVNLHVRPGEMAAVTGPTGCGRTTLLRILFGQDRPDSGAAIVGGRNLGQMGASELAMLRRRTGVVMEDHLLIERLSVLDNVALAAEVRGHARGEALSMAAQTLRDLDIIDCADIHPSALCAGEERSARLARALVIGPDLILADEPTAGMDPDRALAVLSALKAAAAEGTTVLLACNDLEALSEIGARVLILTEGSLYEEGLARRRACA